MNFASKMGAVGLLALMCCPGAGAEEWQERVKLSADFRLRHEYTDIERAPGLQSRNHRSRIRARARASGKISETSTLHFGLVTGLPGDPTTTNQSLGNSNNKMNFDLDLVYFESQVGKIRIDAGKMKNPLFMPGGSELVWDGDLNPEGLIAGFSAEHYFLKAGGLWVLEAGDSAVWVGQGGFRFPAGKFGNLVMGISYDDYVNTRGHAPFINAANGFGNELDGRTVYGLATTYDAAGSPSLLYVKGSANTYKVDFNQLEFMLEWNLGAGRLPLTFSGDYVKNVAVDAEDRGWLLGLRWGEARQKVRNSWELSFNYRELEKNAVLGAFADADFNGGSGTNGRGFKTGFGLMLTEAFLGSFSWTSNRRNIAPGETELDYQKLQFDLSCKI